MKIVCSRTSADVVTIEGDDAGHFLQGQLSADITLLGERGSAWTFLLEPTGKCGFWGRVCATGPDRFALVLPEGLGEAAVARLSRFLLRTDAEIGARTWPVISYRWEGELVGVSSPIAAEYLSARVESAEFVSYDVSTSAHSVGFDVVCVGSTPGTIDLAVLLEETLGDLFEPFEVAAVSLAEIERIRIEAMIPVLGAEIVDGTIPAATGMVDDSASFTKGCYTGQELVARMDSRTAGSPERLVLVRSVGDSVVPAVGASVDVDAVSGRITSVAPAETGWVALAMLPRSVVVEPGDAVAASVAGVSAVLTASG